MAGATRLQRRPEIRTHHTLLFGAIAAFGIGAALPATAQDRASQREDRRTCEGFGLDYGSKGYADCMLAQQQRRDYAPVNAAEAQRANAEAAQRNLETVRRMRCEREAKRDHANGIRPRPCR